MRGLGEPTQSRLRAAAGSGERKTLAGSREGVFSGTHWNLESFPKALLGFWVPPLSVGYGLGTYFKTVGKVQPERDDPAAQALGLA